MLSEMIRNTSRATTILLTIWTIAFTIYENQIFTEAKFEPYQQNGGLVTAIAGKDYILLASDTRLSDGYEIKSRSHLSSRLWTVSPHSPSIGSTSTTTTTTTTAKAQDIFDEDGSIRLPTKMFTDSTNTNLSSKEEQSQQLNHNNLLDLDSHTPIFIGSSGCLADCIALQRQFRSEISAFTYWTSGRGRDLQTSSSLSSSVLSQKPTQSLTPRQVSVLLMNTLYSRRNFPFYAFCLVAGLNSKVGGKGNSDDHGAVYVYDAIGSNERVAVGAVGNGKEMMQPILDRLFASSNTPKPEPEHDDFDPEDEGQLKKDQIKMERDGNAVAASNQKLGNTLLPPVNTCVSCSCEEAVDLVMRGYRSVAEREIVVGDDVVICILKRKADGIGHTLETRKFALRKH